MKIVAPHECPSCSAVLKRVNDQLFCPNTTDCPAQTSKKVQNFCKILKIKGFGEVTVNKLGLIDLNDLFDLTVADAEAAGFSELMANKLVDTLQERISQGITLAEFISANSINLVGETAAKKLATLSQKDLEECSVTTFKSYGLGEVASTNLVEWVYSTWADFYKDTWGSVLSSPKQIQQATTKSGIVVCITGKLNDFSNRSSAAQHLESLGVEVKDSVTKAVNYLICEDGSTSSSSYTKAIKNNIPILTIKDLEEILNDNN